MSRRLVNLTLDTLEDLPRPCRQCEIAAAEAHVARMFHGPALNDAGQPRP